MPLFRKYSIYDSPVTAFKYFNSKEEDWVRKYCVTDAKIKKGDMQT